MPPKETKLYDLLGVPPTASEEQIKRAYKTAAIRLHPDKTAHLPEAERKAAEEKFKEMSSAADVLTDPEKKAKYDRFGEKGLDGSGGGMDPSDIFSSLFGGGRRQDPGERKPKSIMHELPVALENFYNGKCVKLAITRDRLCGTCNGRGSNKEGVSAKCDGCGGRGVRMIVRQLGPGFMQQMQTGCPDCNGRGSSLRPEDRCTGCNGEQITKEKKIFEVHVEKGMKRGDHVTFPNEGDQIPGVRLAGDIIIVLDQKHHDEFTRKGNHLYIERTVSLVEALTGFRRVIKHLDGRSLVIQPPEGTVLDPEFLYIVDREGMPIKGTGGVERGNLIVKFTVKYPQAISAADGKKLRAVLGEPEKVEVPADHDLGTLAKTQVDMTKEASSHMQEDADDEDGDPRARGGAGPGVQCAHQ